MYWSADNLDMATLIRAEDTPFAMKTNGELILVDASIDSHHELARSRLFNNTSRALADGKFYIRNSHTLKGFDLGVHRAARRDNVVDNKRK